METIQFEIQGVAPILLHNNEKLANPLDPLCKELKSVTGKRKKTDADLEEIARIEFEGGLYFHETDGPFIPSRCIQAMMRDAGTINKQGRAVNRGVVVKEDRCPLKYAGPRSIADLFADPQFKDMRPVKVQTSTTIRCRPIFRDWGIKFSLCYQPDVINREEIIEIVERAGMMTGLGDYRPGSPKGGQFGRFEVVAVDGKKINREAA